IRDFHVTGVQTCALPISAVAHALIAAHQAYRRSSEQLASLDDRLGGASVLAEPSAYEEVRDFFHFVDNYIHELDIAAERLAGDRSEERRVGEEGRMAGVG